MRTAPTPPLDVDFLDFLDFLLFAVDELPPSSLDLFLGGIVCVGDEFFVSRSGEGRNDGFWCAVCVRAGGTHFVDEPWKHL